MLLHLTPRMFADRQTEPCSLIDVAITELGLTLEGGNDLTCRRPFQNKNYLVACRKIGQKAMQGILVETLNPVSEFSVTTRWSVATGRIVRHTVCYIVLDSDYGAISENMLLWYGHDDWKHRWPDLPEGTTPANTQPYMEVTPRNLKQGPVMDEVDDDGLLIERIEFFRLRTLERERVLNPALSAMERTPTVDHVFMAMNAP